MTAAKKATAAKATEVVKVRLVVASHGASVGDVVETTPDRADRLVRAGLARHVD